MPSEYEVGVILPPDIVTVSVGIAGLQGPQGTAGPPGVSIGTAEPANTGVLWADTSEVGDAVVPAGGTAGQVLAKVSSSDYDTAWDTLTAADVGAYSSSNPSNFISAAGAPVQSVNGATGTVVLNAANVGALGTAGGTATGKLVAPDFDYGVTTAGSDTVALDFSTGDGYVSRAVSGTAVSITGTGYTPGVTRTVLLVGGTAVASLSVPADWKFVGTAAGTALGTAVTAVVTATSFGTAAADVVAAYAKQP